MGRIASTTGLKPHERALNALGMDADYYQLILATLGISKKYPESTKDLLDHDRLRLSEQVVTPFTFAQLKQLPALNLETEHKEVSGTWESTGGELVIGAGNDYAQALDQAVQEVMPDWIGQETEIPITILLPGQAQQTSNDLVGAESHWRFITAQMTEEQGLFSSEAMQPVEKANLAIRLYSACKFLGLVGTQQSVRNGSRICLELLQAIGIDDQLEYLSAARLQEWSKQQQKWVKLEDNQRHTLLDKLRKIKSTSTKTDIQLQHKQTKLDEVCRKIEMVEREIAVLLKQEPTDLNIKPVKNRAFYYAIPPHTLNTLDPSYKAVAGSKVFPTLSPKEGGLAYTTVCLGQAKEKDPTALIRTAQQLRVMLAYLCPMTSGTAITFKVPKRAYSEGRKVIGVTSPTMILPRAWADLALGLKQYTKNTVTKPMSDEDYESQGMKADFVSAIYADYDTKQDELLRVLPTLENDKAIDF
ncbi:hypothetical protein GCM10009104_23760 [Marinobacterium maritimum]|uniref:Uncharacterized protein n=1 Tax=Marinobacterium maritimum TaxID=500162 RepID=A0ABP3TD68_9GAMM